MWTDSPVLQKQYALPLDATTASLALVSLDPSIPDTLTTYTIISQPSSLPDLLTPILSSYISSVTTAPPAPSQSRSLATACEICERAWIPLTYHHLIPKAVHAKALKRGWHREDDLNAVAWLCRACHSFVHRIASHEELAREWFTVDLLMERDDVEKWAAWVGKVRWKAR